MKRLLALCAALSALFALTLVSEEAVEACRGGLRICAELIVPRIFPYFVLSGILSLMGLPQLLGKVCAPFAEKYFRVSGAGFSAFFIGILGGYPMGAAAVCDMNEAGLISDDESERLLIFCNNTGPAFTVGALGAGIWQNERAGVMLYIIHIISALLCGLLIAGEGKFSPDSLPEAEEIQFPAALTRSVKNAVISTLNVCGFIISFAVLLGLLEASGFLGTVSGFACQRTGLSALSVSALLKGLTELGSGIAALKGLPLSPRSYAMAAFMLGFGSLSVHFQTMALFSDKKIKCGPHFMGRILSAAIAAIFAYMAAGLFL